MNDKKYFNSHSQALVALTDFIKWVSTLSANDVKQIDQPLPGIRFAPSVSELFAIAEDPAGAMLVIAKSEGHWLSHFPVELAYLNKRASLVLVTQSFNLFDVPFHSLCVELSLALTQSSFADQLALCKVLGFGLIEGERITRVNKIITLEKMT